MGNCCSSNPEAGHLKVEHRGDAGTAGADVDVHGDATHGAYRGKQQRREVHAGQIDGNDSHAPASSYAKPLDTIPNYSNPNTLATLQVVGDYQYRNDEPGDFDLPFLGPYELENGSVYIGQW